jgi:hypothetical protein
MVTSLTAAAASFFSRSRGGCETGQSSPENVTCRVFVRIDGMPAPPTREHRLAGAVLSCCVPAGFTAVRGVPGVHVDHHTSSLFRFGAQDRHELGPAHVMDVPVQAGLGGGPVGQEPALMVGIRPGAGSPYHVADLQVLHDQQAMVGDERPGRVMVEVASLVGELAIPGRDCRSGSATVVGAPLLAARTCWAVLSLAAAARPKRGLGKCSPSEVVAKLAIPTSIPTAALVGAKGRVGTWSHDRTSIHRRPWRRIWMVLTRPWTWRCMLAFTCPIPWRYTRWRSGCQRQPSPSTGHSTLLNRCAGLNRG